MKNIAINTSDDKVTRAVIFKLKPSGNLAGTAYANSYWAQFADNADFSFLSNPNATISTAQPHTAGLTVTDPTVNP